MIGRYYDKSGVPIDMDVCSRLLQDAEYRKVGLSDQNGVSISTVWLGLNHAWSGPPLIFETMVFGGEFDGEQERYSTLEEAIKGHEAMIEKVHGGPNKEKRVVEV